MAAPEHGSTSSHSQPAEQPVDTVGGPPAGPQAAASGLGHMPHELPASPLFEDDELARFQSDDHQAGRAIGKMLASFFFYTVVVMSIVVWWTISTLSD
ncbi:MAG: hypothetical protein KY476_14500 [Planctomycetes bacterium]|nr:hypothetical protein [Planctomycetota bacterium]